MADAARNASQRGFMKNIIHVLHGRVQRVKISYVCFVERDFVERVGEILSPAVAEVVVDNNLVATRKEGVNQMRADKPGAAGDQGSWHCFDCSAPAYRLA